MKEGTLGARDCYCSHQQHIFQYGKNLISRGVNSVCFYYFY